MVDFLNDEGRIKQNAEKRKSRGKKTAREMWRDQKRSWEQDEEIETRIWVKVQFYGGLMKILITEQNKHINDIHYIFRGTAFSKQSKGE